MDQEDPLEKEMATRSRVLASEIQQTEEYSGLQSMVSEESDMTQRLNYHTDRDTVEVKGCLAFLSKQTI